MAYPTKWYSSTMQGAPTLSGTAGAGITFFDAVLKDGFGSLTLDSLAVASDVATGTYSSGHAYLQWSVIEIAGATPSGLNGQKRITSVTGTTFTFTTSGIGDQTATGTITAKIPAAGWTKPYTGTNLAAYRLDTVAGTGGYLRVDDTGTTDMRVVGYMAMSDVNTGTDPFPTSAQISGGGYFRKSSAASATTRPWIAIADDRFFYLAVNADGAGTFEAYAFGDFCSFSGIVSGPWDCMMACGSSGTAGPLLGYTGGANASCLRYIPRLVDATPGAVNGNSLGHGLYSGDGTTIDIFPNPSTGGILAVEGTIVLQGLNSVTTGLPRGTHPGYIQFLNDCITEFTWGTPILLSGLSEMIMPVFTGETSGDVFGVSLGSWR